MSTVSMGTRPVLHTVNSNVNRSEPIMRLLLAAGTKADIQLAGITWGKEYEWETTFFDVTPISYAQMGLLPQVHRREDDIYSNLRCLLEASGRTVPPLTNVPNRYLRPKSRPDRFGHSFVLKSVKFVRHGHTSSLSGSSSSSPRRSRATFP